jgi:hypothetical protein
MSFSLFGSKSKGKSKTDTTTTTTPNVPDWLQAQAQGQSGRISEIGMMDPSKLVAGVNPLQQKAVDMAGKLDGLGGLSSAPTVTGQSLLTGLGDYFNPYQKEVIDSSTADFDHNASMQQSQRALDRVRSGAFGGSGAAIAQAEGDDASNRARASMLSGLRSQGFDTAANLSGQDAARRQEAGVTNANNAMRFAEAQDAAQRADMAAIFGMGTDLRAIETQQLTAPLDLQAWMNEQFGTIPGAMFVGNTSHEVGTSKTSGSNIGFSATVKK